MQKRPNDHFAVGPLVHYAFSPLRAGIIHNRPNEAAETPQESLSAIESDYKFPISRIANYRLRAIVPLMSRGWGSPVSRKKGEQLTFADRRCRDGSKRKRAGRKPAPERPNVRHYTRPRHSKWNPIHITMRAVTGLPSFREPALYLAFEQSVRLTQRPDFRIVEFSVQTNHLHLIVEAQSNEALARGMKSFEVRTNRRFNSTSGRGRGKVWADRYHREDLTTPRQVRNALVYCLANFRKHTTHMAGARTIDWCSSARWFTGWNAQRTSANDNEPRPSSLARVPLLTHLWHARHGLIDPREAPRRRAA